MDKRRKDAPSSAHKAGTGEANTAPPMSAAPTRSATPPMSAAPDGGESYISFDNLSVGYSGNALIHDICLDIKRGEIVAMIGPNGAGKSTILKTVTRQLAKIRGDVNLEGRDMHRIPYAELSKKMAVVLTERLKTELLTCYDIVASGRYPYTGRLGVLQPEDEAMVDAAIAAVNATELGPKDFNAISDGQRQRILLARAICQDPELIILDEPTSFLDIRYKLELLGILRNMAKRKGITVIMSLHEIDLAEKIADKVICVKGDHIYRYGSPEEIFKEEMIRELYEIDNGFFDPLFGSIELPAPDGNGWSTAGAGSAGAIGNAGAGGTTSAAAEREGNAADVPDVFVISSCGTGIPVFRLLQKENASFAAGILYENDMDYRLARLLAKEVVKERPFEVISQGALERAKELIELCPRVIFAEFPIGTSNQKVEELVELARSKGKLEIM